MDEQIAEKLKRAVGWDDLCKCGDARHEHENGRGKCNVCDERRQLFPVCQRFRKETP